MVTKIKKPKNVNDNESFSLEKTLQGADLITKFYEFLKAIIFVLPIALILGIVPTIVYLKEAVVDPNILMFWTGEKNYDFFSYYKTVWLLVFTFLSIGFLIIRLYFDKEKKIKNSFYYIPSYFYMFFIVLSTVMSHHKQVSLWGFPDRYEGMFVLLSYVVVFLITSFLADNKKAIQFLYVALFSSALVICTIGIFQFFGWDLFKTHNGKLLILPDELHYFADQLKFQFGAYTIYTTLYNTNFVGSYSVMLLMISITFFFLTKNVYLKVFFWFFSLLLFGNWVGCLSRAGIIGGVVALALFALLLRKQLIKQWYLFLSIVLAFGCLVFTMDKISNGFLSGKMKTLDANAEMAKFKVGVGQVTLKKITATDKEISIITDKDILTAVYENDISFKFFDKNKNPVYPLFNTEKQKFSFKEANFQGIMFLVDTNSKIFQFDINGKTLNFYTNGKFMLIDRSGNPFDVKPVPSIGFEGREKFGSQRGYNWSRTFPMLKDSFIKGFGPDTFAIYFPQHDVLGKFLAYDDPYIIVDKPHDMYLQIATNTGVLSLIAVLVLFGWYFFTSFILYIKNPFENLYSISGVAVFLAFSGYCVTAIFNDSLVSVAPVFWILLGLGVASNTLYKQVKENDKKEDILVDKVPVS